MDELRRAVEWHKQAVPNPTIESAAKQVGCHFEEFGEMVEAINLGGMMIQTCIEKEANEFKINTSDYYIHKIEDCDMEGLLDSLCDQIVTAAGVAHSLGFDLIGALKEVNDSNYSKFVNGKAVFDKNGKIDKPASYKPPQLERFIK